MQGFTVKSYWKSYYELSADIRKQADAKFALWKEDPFHPSLRFKCTHSKENIWSVRINLDYRALGVRDGDQIIWFWIGNHEEYEKMLKSN